jgi:hypothetical protein
MKTKTLFYLVAISLLFSSFIAPPTPLNLNDLVVIRLFNSSAANSYLKKVNPNWKVLNPTVSLIKDTWHYKDKSGEVSLMRGYDSVITIITTNVPIVRTFYADLKKNNMISENGEATFMNNSFVMQMVIVDEDTPIFSISFQSKYSYLHN